MPAAGVDTSVWSCGAGTRLQACLQTTLVSRGSPQPCSSSSGPQGSFDPLSQGANAQIQTEPLSGIGGDRPGCSPPLLGPVTSLATLRVCPTLPRPPQTQPPATRPEATQNDVSLTHTLGRDALGWRRTTSLWCARSRAGRELGELGGARARAPPALAGLVLHIPASPLPKTPFPIPFSAPSGRQSGSDQISFGG
ncbi:PREDICTED: uncharacterized protein LOC108514157 isoform X1 [Rhinopithecus bieti]|uniref:uncharacterized protein LOC108514157 isoform X1 n=2 Tax=Rhinopithecus bieti TaxID=61621 RepID=UPI00083C2A0B|nr:PREDICTED: uncharacterized protein LOC108514157 isoform X1 [Rhinopithecus bieti]